MNKYGIIVYASRLVFERNTPNYVYTPIINYDNTSYNFQFVSSEAQKLGNEVKKDFI